MAVTLQSEVDERSESVKLQGYRPVNEGRRPAAHRLVAAVGCGDDDTDTDGTITADELRTNALIMSLLSPDVDLFGSMGNDDPRVDGVNDSLSFGVGFTAVGAVFDLP